MAKKKYIETPEKMWELFQEYAKYTKDNPKKVIDFKGSDVQTVYYEKEIPLTMVGFENYVFKKDMITQIHHYFANRDDRYSEYVLICSRIRGEIKADQIEGGMAGVYNASITQRLNNLTEKTENTIKVGTDIEETYD